MRAVKKIVSMFAAVVALSFITFLAFSVLPGDKCDAGAD